MHTPGGWGCLDLRWLHADVLLSCAPIIGRAQQWYAHGQLGAPAQSQPGAKGRLHWAKTNTLCWNPDSTHGQNSVSEWWCGCLDCSHDLAWCHDKDPGMYPRCFPANKSSKNLEHHRVRCQYTAPPWRVTGSSLVLAVLEPVKLLCTVLLKSRVLSRRAKYYLWEEFQFSEFLLSVKVDMHIFCANSQTDSEGQDTFSFFLVKVQLLNSHNYMGWFLA